MLCNIDVCHDEVIELLEQVVPVAFHGSELPFLVFVKEHHFADQQVAGLLEDIELLSGEWDETSPSTLEDLVPVVAELLGDESNHGGGVELEVSNSKVDQCTEDSIPVGKQNGWVVLSEKAVCRSTEGEALLCVVLEYWFVVHFIISINY